jgi:hypothetical protein
MDFRSDINGLRAYAVLAVLLYHFGISGFTGGFAGVDVFFVLSGYLMTAIIAEPLLAGRFSLVDFTCRARGASYRHWLFSVWFYWRLAGSGSRPPITRC